MTGRTCCCGCPSADDVPLEVSVSWLGSTSLIVLFDFVKKVETGGAERGMQEFGDTDCELQLVVKWRIVQNRVMMCSSEELPVCDMPSGSAISVDWCLASTRRGMLKNGPIKMN